MSIQVVTIANAPPAHDYMCYWEMIDSVRQHNMEPLILGLGQLWGGLGSKPRILKKAIEDGRIDSDHIIFIDAFDVVLARHPSAIVEKFREFKTDIVWNAEKNCFPIVEIACDYPPTDSPWKYLNSGFCVARTDAMLELLKHIDADAIPDDHKNPDGTDNNPNDQAYMSLAFVEKPQCVPMKLDYNTEICMNMVDVGMDEIMLMEDGILNARTGAWPMAYHWAGGSKTSGTMLPILKHLNLR